MMSLADEVRAEMAAEKKAKAVYGPRAILPRDVADANKAAFLEPSVEKGRWYHGTKRNFTRFQPTQADAVFATPEPTFASGFAHGAIETTDPIDGASKTTFLPPDKLVPDANILPLRVQVKNPFDYENPEHIEAVRKYLREKVGMEERYVDSALDALTDPDRTNNWMEIEHPNIQRAIKHLGHDAFYTKELNTKNLGIYNPNAVKSDIGNIGTWSLDTPEITEKKGGLVGTSRTA